MSEALLRLAAAIAAAGVEQLRADLAEPVSAGAPSVVDLATAVPGDAVVARSPLSGATAGDLFTIVSAADLGSPGDEPPALHLADPLLAGAAAALAGHTGAEVAVGPAETLAEFDPAAAAEGAVAVTFQLIVGEAAPVPIVWVFPAALAAGLPPPADAPAVAAASFPELGRGASPNGMRDLSVLAEVAMDVTVELGRARLKVRDLLSLQTGSIVELDRAAGAAVDVLVNGTVVAHGDVVVIDDDLGVRITAVVDAP